MAGDYTTHNVELASEASGGGTEAMTVSPGLLRAFAGQMPAHAEVARTVGAAVGTQELPSKAFGQLPGSRTLADSYAKRKDAGAEELHRVDQQFAEFGVITAEGARRIADADAQSAWRFFAGRDVNAGTTMTTKLGQLDAVVEHGR
jgi:hypothetical protein